MRRRDHFGIHIISDLYGCDPEKLKDMERIKYVLEMIIQQSELTTITSHFHQFNPCGVTGFVLLSESHLAIHTWPEYGYVSVDVYSCGPSDGSASAHKGIVDFFTPKKTSTSVFTRGKPDEAHNISNIKTVSNRT